MCSKCWKDSKAQGPQSSAQAGVAVPEPEVECTPVGKSPLADVAKPAADGAGLCVPIGASPGTTTTPAKKKKAKNRCLICRKKVGLTGFSCRCVLARAASSPWYAMASFHLADCSRYVCRCGGLFCGAHRMSDAHQCTFDYKAHSSEQLQKSGRVDKVVPDKVTKI